MKDGKGVKQKKRKRTAKISSSIESTAEDSAAGSVDDFFDQIESGVHIDAPSSDTKAAAKKDKKSKKSKKSKAVKKEKPGKMKVVEKSSAVTSQQPDADSGSSSGSDDDGDDADSDMLLHIAAHKRQLAALAETDPEFHAYLQQESNLLDFGSEIDTAAMGEMELEDEDEDAVEASDGGDDDGSDEMQTEQPAQADATTEKAMDTDLQSNKPQLDMKTLQRWQTSAKNGKEKGVNELFKAFAAASVLLQDDGSNVGKLNKTSSQKQASSAVRRFKYRIESGSVFDELLICMTRDMPAVLGEVFERPAADSEDGVQQKIWRPQKSKKWAGFAKAVSEYCRNLLALLEAVTESDMTSWVLKAIGTTLPFFVATPLLPRKLLKVSLSLWAIGEEAVRVRAYFTIRNLVEMFPKKLLPLAMKGMYLTYIRHTKTSNPKSLPRVNFFVACITDVFGMNVQLAYEIAFTYIRSNRECGGCWVEAGDGRWWWVVVVVGGGGGGWRCW